MQEFASRGLMMKATCWFVVFAFAVMLSVAPFVSAQEDSNADAVTKIVALEKAWNQAYKMRDTKAVDALLAEGMVLVNDDGSLLSKGAFLSIIRASKPSEEEQVTPESITVHVYATGVAVATGVFRAKGIEAGKPYVRRNRFADTWVVRNGNWVCVSASATPILH